MNSTDLIAMIGNLSRSLFSVQLFVSAIAYLLGIAFFYLALVKFKKLGGHGGHEKAFVPLAYLLGGVALLYFPSSITVLTNTTFGSGNILQYSTYNPYDIYNSMGLLIRTIGGIWFVRGCVLLVHASEPGEQHGPKGLLFLAAGILAINFDNTVAFLSNVMERLASFTLQGGS